MSDLALIDNSLEKTRPERVLAALDRPAPWQVELLGPVPRTFAARAVWCDAADRIEARMDRNTWDENAWRRVCKDIADTAELCAIAERYLELEGPLTRVHQWSHQTQQTKDLRDELFDDTTAAWPGERIDLDRGIEIDM
jgi:hypothetical protein